ncbi:response regulator [Paenibacillus wynnii]|uniref:Transcriptional regulatory protein n=1 Tax=Paenibacillus wynnii TaxID=268407 RepID=A0A098M958_9BACL|nr:response regulator [Paenibacillus wynnii]KGE18591.1 transcriptional regulator [Paenibacillus wynnii]
MIKVLIVEDDPMVAKFNKHYLEQIEGFQSVGWAASGDEAIELIEELEVDLILLDVYMQNTNGLQLLSFLRQQAKSVDAIVISAASDNISIRKALQFGAVDYLIKPFEFSRFAAAMTAYRENYFLMKKGENFNQQELDKLLRYRQEPEDGSPALPKGLTVGTLRSMWSIITTLSEGAFSTEELTAKSLISRISVRKYLAFLTEIGVLSMETSYGSVGRPVYMYRVTLKGNEIIEGLIK